MMRRRRRPHRVSRISGEITTPFTVTVSALALMGLRNTQALNMKSFGHHERTTVAAATSWPSFVVCRTPAAPGAEGVIRSRQSRSSTLLSRVPAVAVGDGRRGRSFARHCMSEGDGVRSSAAAGTGASAASRAGEATASAAEGGFSETQAQQTVVDEGSAVRQRKKLDDLEVRQKKFTTAMTTLSSTRLWKAVPALIAEAGRVGLPLNVICVNAAMSAFSKSGRWMEALQLLSQMRRGTCLKDVCGGEAATGGAGGGAEGGGSIAYSLRMRNVPETVLDTVSGKWKEADGDSSGGVNHGVETEEEESPLMLPKPDVITYNIAISACGKGKRWQAAVELLETMREEGLAPDGFSYSAAISACKRCGEWEQALKLVEGMRFEGLGRDRHSLNAAIAACATAGQWQPALEILLRMETKGPEPDVFTYSSVIDACARGGKLDLALETLEGMRDEDSASPAPNAVCYNVALQGLLREGRWWEARQLLSGASGSSRLDYLSYNSVIRACAEAGAMEEAFKTKAEMSAAGITADPFTYEALAAGCAMVGDWRSAEALVRDMLNERNRVLVANRGTRPYTRGSDNDSEGNKGDPKNNKGNNNNSQNIPEAVPENDHEWIITRKRWRRADGVRIFPSVFHGLMEAYARAGEWQRAVDCLDDMAHPGDHWEGKEEPVGAGTEGDVLEKIGRSEGQEGLTAGKALEGGGQNEAGSGEEQQKQQHEGKDEMPGVGMGAGIAPDAVCFGWAMKACADAGEGRITLSLLAGMRTENIRPGQLCFDAALQACAQTGAGTQALSILTEMTSLSPPAAGDGGDRSFTTASGDEVEVGGTTAESEKVVGAAAGSLSESAGAPKPGSINSYRLCMEAFRRSGDAAGALSVLARMRAEGWQPDVACFNEALRACAEGGGRWKRAMGFLEEMQYAGLVPNGVSYSTTLQACESSAGEEGVAEAACALIHTMSSSSASHVVLATYPNADSDSDSDSDSSSRSNNNSNNSLRPTARDYLAAMRACGGSVSGSSSSSSSNSSNSSNNNGNNRMPDWRSALRLLSEVKLATASHKIRAVKQASTTSLFRKYSNGNSESSSNSSNSSMNNSGNDNRKPLVETRQQETSTATSEGQSIGTEKKNVQARGVTGSGKTIPANVPPTAEAGQIAEQLVPFGELSQEHYHAAIAACGGGGNTNGVLSLLSELRSRGKDGSGGGAGLRRRSGSGSEFDEGEKEEMLLLAAEATRAAAEARIIPRLLPATYAVAAEALADAAEWEWCLVLLEELEQQQILDGDKKDKTLEDLDVAMEVVIDSETGMPATDAVAAAKRRGVTDTIRTYIAALRACGKGRAEPRDVLGVLERIRWAGVVEANEGVYAAAIRALRVCGSDGGGGGGVSGGVGGGVVGASEAARDLIEWDGKRGSTGANLFLYSAAIKVCAEEDEIAAAKELFLEARKSDGASVDPPSDIAEAALAAATKAAREGLEKPDTPPRLNRGLEAVYNAMLEVCVAAGDGSLARDVLRWMKMERFEPAALSYTLAIKACCNRPSSLSHETTANPRRRSERTSSDSLPNITAPDMTSTRRPAAQILDRGSESSGGGVNKRGEWAAAQSAAGAGSRSRPPLPPPRVLRDEDDGREWVVVPGGRRQSPFAEDQVDEGFARKVAAAKEKQFASKIFAARKDKARVRERQQRGERGSQPDDVGKGNAGEPAPSTAAAAAAVTTPVPLQFPSPQAADGDATPAVKPSSGSTVVTQGGVRFNFGAKKGVDWDKVWELASPSPSPPSSPDDRGGGEGEGGGQDVIAAGAGATDETETRIEPRTERTSVEPTPTRTVDVGGSIVAADSTAAAAAAVLPTTPTSIPQPNSGASTSVDVSSSGITILPTRTTDYGGAAAAAGTANVGTSGGAGGAEGVEWERACALLSDMEVAQLKPPVEAFEAVLGACIVAGKVGEALEVAQAMEGVGYRPDGGLLTRLTMSHADVLEREAQEIAAAAAGPPEDWGIEMEMAGGRIQRGRPGEIDGDYMVE